MGPGNRGCCGGGELLLGGECAPCNREELVLAQELADPGDRLTDVLLGVGVGDPQVALAARPEVRTAEHRYAGLLEQRVRQRRGLPPRPGDVRKGVERALRVVTTDPGE